jgi:hypothetical protein
MKHRSLNHRNRRMAFESLEGRALLSGDIQGTVFNDFNGNGLRDSDESALAGLVMYLDTNNNGRFDPRETVALADSSGNYRFSGLAAGTYAVGELVPTGFLPSFARQAKVATFINDPGPCVAADLDADKDRDLAVLIPNSNAVVLMTNNGSGIMTRGATLTVGRYPLGIAAADVNGDGSVDLVTANAMGNSVSVMVNNGQESFTVLPPLAVGAYPRAITDFDYDGDGDKDLAVVCEGDNAITVLRNDGMDNRGLPRFTSIGVPKSSGPSNPCDIVAGDLNADGRSDLAVAYMNSNEVVVYLNSAGGFSSSASAVKRLPVGQSPAWLATADFNADGRMDLVAANRDSNNVSVLTNQGNAVFQTASFPTGQTPRDVAAADMNGDGRQDIITTDRDSHTATVLLNNGNGTLARPIHVPAGDLPVAVTPADLNGDGRADLALTAVNSTSKELSVWLNTGGLQRVTLTSGQTTALQVNVGNLAAVPSLIQFLDADGSINRQDIIQILRSVGGDGVVDAVDLADLRSVLSNASAMNIPGYVQVLARAVVNSNQANAHYQGQTLGNLAIGSTSDQLNKLINKWFFGADHPDSGGYTYRSVAGSLFVNGAAHTDMYQGAVGDCYLIASLGAIAKSSAIAAQNMFIDNGDGTWTVRFYYNGTPDYVTVDRMLPTDSNACLVYANAGLSSGNTGSELWIPLAEKAYAQWNETGKANRGMGLDGMNTYSSLTNGSMSDVDQQVLGRPADAWGFNDAYKPILVGAVSANKALTIGTVASTQPDHTLPYGLYGPHAYVVTAYNVASDTFQLYNPWGCLHPGPLTWSQLKAECQGFVVADTSGTVSPRVAMAAIPARNVVSPIAAPSTLRAMAADELAMGWGKSYSSRARTPAWFDALQGDNKLMAGPARGRQTIRSADLFRMMATTGES